MSCHRNTVNDRLCFCIYQICGYHSQKFWTENLTCDCWRQHFRPVNVWLNGHQEQCLPKLHAQRGQLRWQAQGWSVKHNVLMNSRLNCESVSTHFCKSLYIFLILIQNAITINEVWRHYQIFIIIYVTRLQISDINYRQKCLFIVNWWRDCKYVKNNLNLGN